MKDSIKKERVPFTQIANDLLNDPSLDLKAKGLYCWMYSKPNDFKFNADSIAKQTGTSRNTILKLLKDLKASNWLEYRKNNNGSGEYLLKVINLQVAENQPKSKKSTLPKSNFATVQKLDPINNKDLINNKERYIYAQGEIFDFENFKVDNQENEKIIAEAFDQTTEVLRMRLSGFLFHLWRNNRLGDFLEATRAYLEYKALTKEMLHSWATYSTEAWESTNWPARLEKYKNRNLVQNPKISKYADY